jgi:chitodextrinase
MIPSTTKASRFLLPVIFYLLITVSNTVSAQVSIQSAHTDTGADSTFHTLTAVPAGALLVLACQSETSVTNSTISSNPVLTWTKRVDASTFNSGDAEIWTAVMPSTGNITVKSDFGSGNQSSVCYVIINQETTPGGASAVGNSQGQPSVNITTTRANSIIIAATSDWNAVEGDEREYLNSPVEHLYYYLSTKFTSYNYTKAAATVATYTLGLDEPTGQSAGTVLYEVRSSLVTDTIAPSSFNLSTTGQSATQIGLSWTSATDNVGVTGYEVYVNNIYKATTTGTTYTVTGLTPATQYNMYVRAKDAGGNGTNSDTITVNTDTAAAVTIVHTSTDADDSATTHILTSVPAGALLVLTTANETDIANCTVTSSPSLTWTKRGDAENTHSGNAEIYTAVFAAGGNITVTSSWGITAQSSVCYVVTNYDPGMAGHAAFAASQTEPSVERNTGRANSIIFCVTSDWNAEGGSRTYRNAPVEKFYGHSANHFTYYHYIKEATTVGSYEMGLSAPTGQNAGTVTYEVRSLPDTSERQHLLFDQGFEGAHAWDNFKTGQDAGHAWSRQLSDTHANEGTHSFRAEVRSGCDGFQSAGYRSEIEPMNIQDTGIMWYGFSIYFDTPFSGSNWTGSASGHYIQWHPSNSGGSATMALMGSSGTWNLVTNPSGGGGGSHHNTNIAITRGWHHFVFKVNWSNTNGYVKVWIDGTLVYDLAHNTASSYYPSETLNWHTAGRYLKMGMNRWGNCNTSACSGGAQGPCDTWILYYDNIRIGDAQATYNDVAPATGGGSRIAMPRVLPAADNKPANYALAQNVPNPVHGQTSIQYMLPQAEQVNLSVFDVNGRLVRVLVNGAREAGTYTVPVNMNSLAKGVYYYKIQAGAFVEVKKMVVQ